MLERLLSPPPVSPASGRLASRTPSTGRITPMSSNGNGDNINTNNTLLKELLRPKALMNEMWRNERNLRNIWWVFCFSCSGQGWKRIFLDDFGTGTGTCINCQIHKEMIQYQVAYQELISYTMICKLGCCLHPKRSYKISPPSIMDTWIIPKLTETLLSSPWFQKIPLSFTVYDFLLQNCCLREALKKELCILKHSVN